MLIEEMMSKRDFATNMCVAIQNQLGKDWSGVYDMEDFETKNEDEFKDFVMDQFKNGYHALIFTGWAFTKEIYYKIKDYVKYLIDSEERYCYPIFCPEIITFILVDTEENLVSVFKKLNKEIIEASNLNIRTIDESDNAIQINYFTKSAVKFFEEKPKPIEDIIKNE